MRILISHHQFAEFAGTETYILTVAMELQRLGHDVAVYTPSAGPMAEFARDRGVPVLDAADQLPASCDAVLAQDASTALLLAQRYPGATRVFVAHSDFFALQAPPQLDGVLQAVVVLNDRVRRFIEGLGFHAPIVRLRQPIDLRRFSPHLGVSDTVRRALLLGNYLHGPLVDRLSAACEAAGVELVLAGMHSTPTQNPELAIGQADVVLGLGRCVLEAMACGRAAYVYGIAGGDGWVTPDRYAGLEADGFGGRGTTEVVDPDRLTADLRVWSPEMGVANRHLAAAHHGARAHALELVALVRRLGASPSPPPALADELARLVRLEWQTWGLYHGAREENRIMRETLDKQRGTLEEQHGTLEEQHGTLEQQRVSLEEQHREIRRLSDLRAELIDALARSDQARVEALASIEALRATRRYRWAGRIAAPLDTLRRQR